MDVRPGHFDRGGGAGTGIRDLTVGTARGGRDLFRRCTLLTPKQSSLLRFGQASSGGGGVGVGGGVVGVVVYPGSGVGDSSGTGSGVGTGSGSRAVTWIVFSVCPE